MEVSDAASHQQPAPVPLRAKGDEIVETRNHQLKTPRLPGTCPPEKAIELEEEKKSIGTPFKISRNFFKKIN